MRSVGERIRALRDGRGLRQGDLGYTQNFIWRLETGDRRPSEETLRGLAERLRTTAHYLEAGLPSKCPHCGRFASGRRTAQSGIAATNSPDPELVGKRIRYLRVTQGLALQAELPPIDLEAELAKARGSQRATAAS
jgi:Helix-turn-helix domain